MADRVATAPVAVREDATGPIMWFRRAFLKYEPLRGFSLLSPTLLLLLVALALPIGLLVTFSFWTQDYLDFDRTFTVANYAVFFQKKI